MKHRSVDRFFRRYKEYVQEVWDLDEPEGDLCREGFGNEEYRIQAPGLSHEEIQLLSSSLPSQLKIPDDLNYFWSAYRYFELGIPLVNFHPTEEDSFRDTTLPIFDFFSNEGFATIGTDESGGVSFCVDLRNSSEASEDPPIVLLRPGARMGEIDIAGPMFSSFEKLLSILTEIMSAFETLYWEEDPAQEQVALIRRLKTIDPEGFGGVGWEARWSQWIFRGTDPT